MNKLARVDFGRVAGVPFVAVRGEIDLSNASDVLEAGVEAAVSDGPPALIVDLSDVSYVDSAGIRALFELGERLAALGNRMLTVVPENAPIMRVLELADAASALAVCPTVEAAVARVNED